MPLRRVIVVKEHRYTGDVGSADVDVLRADARGLLAALWHRESKESELGTQLRGVNRRVMLLTAVILLAQAFSLTALDALYAYAALVSIGVLPGLRELYSFRES